MRMGRLGICLVCGLLGCSGKQGDDTGRSEGDIAGDERIEGQLGGDCSDGSDNDLDGYFDCDDEGCVGSPDCEGGSGALDSGALDSGALDSGESTEEHPPLETTINTVAWGCTESDYFYDVYTVGWSVGGWLFTYQNTLEPWSEDHPIPVYESDPDGYWSHLYLDLVIVSPRVDKQESGISTLYTCDDMKDTLTFIIEVDDMNGVENVECVVWGADPDSVDADDCERIEAGEAEQLR